MKKLVITTAIVCLSTASVFAAGKVELKVKTETRIKTDQGGKIGQDKLGSTSSARTNIGTGTGISADADNILTQTVSAVVADKLQNTTACNINFSDAAVDAIAQATARKLSATKCLESKFADDKEVQITAQVIISSMNKAFTDLGVKDLNGDKKIDANDLANDSERAVILKAGAKALSQRISTAIVVALQRLKGTRDASCDLVSKELGTDSAFNSAEKSL